MLSKEEIENIICNADFAEGKDKQVEQVWVNVSFLDHITAERNKYKDKADHLESREQKLIEKLEEINTRNVELYNSPKQKEVDFSEWNLAQELLEILKKE